MVIQLCNISWCKMLTDLTEPKLLRVVVYIYDALIQIVLNFIQFDQSMYFRNQIHDTSIASTIYRNVDRGIEIP